jgi:hypothetical protein
MLNEQWWTMEGRQLSNQLCATTDDINRATMSHQQRALDSYGIYGGEGTLSTNAVARILPAAQRLGVNVTASAVDTLVAEVTRTPPAPMVVTRGGDWFEQRRAEDLSAFAGTVIDHQGGPLMLHQASADAVVAGLGCVRAYDGGEHVELERIHPLSILVDDAQCVDVEPRELYIRRAIPRHHMMATYADRADDLEHAKTDSRGLWYAGRTDVDMLEVFEAWHLPSSLGADDGKHVIVCGDIEPLLDEQYERPRYPMAFIRCVPGRRGWWGESLVERAEPVQAELNKLLRRIQDSMHLHAVKRIYVQAGSVCKGHMQNKVGNIVEFTGATPPVEAANPSMPRDVYNQVQDYKSEIYRIFGVSELGAAAQKPPGIEAAKALRYYHHYTTVRHRPFERSLRQAVCHLAEDIIETTRTIAEREGAGFKVYYRTRQGHAMAAKVWSKLSIDRDRLLYETKPVSALAESAPDQLQDLKELVHHGVIDEVQFLRMTKDPDFEALREELVAPEQNIRRMLYNIVESGEYEPPDPMMDLATARRVCLLTVQSCQVNEVPQERIDLLRRWWLDIAGVEKRRDMMVANMMAAEAPPPMGPPGMPPGGPMPPGPPGPMPPGAGPPMMPPGAPGQPLGSPPIPARSPGPPGGLVPPTG